MREAKISRKTKEVAISGSIAVDGQGATSIKTGFDPLDHLLTVFSFHGLFDLALSAQGDLQHHIIEDIGIALGKAFKEALKDKAGINRYGCFTLVMDKTAVEVALDISGRPTLHREIAASEKVRVEAMIQDERFDNTSFTYKDAEGFLESFLQHAGISCVYIVKACQGDLHHLLETLFKGLGKALDMASRVDPRRKDVPSTKGVID